MLALLRHDDQQRPFVPLGMGDADHRRLGDVGMADGEILDVDRRNPFAARLDHVFGAVGDLHVAFGIDRRDVAGVEEAVLVEDVALLLEIAPGDGRTGDLEAAEAFAVPRQFPVLGVDDLHLDAEGRPALLDLAGENVFGGRAFQRRLDRTDRAERAHLGHAPGVAHFDAVIPLEGADHRRRAGRAADDHRLQRGELLALLLQIGEQHQPHRRHGGGEIDLLGLEQFVNRRAVEPRARHHQLGAAHRGGEGETPGIGVEHRHDRHHCRFRADRQTVDPRADQRMQDVGAMRIEHALGIAGGAGSVAEAGGGVLLEFGPAEVAVDLGQPFFVGHGVGELRRRHMRGVGQHDVTLDRRQLRRQPLEQGDESEVDEHQPILGVVHDPADLVGKQPRIDGVIDRAEPRNAVPRLEVAVVVPGERRHAVAELDSVAREPLRDLQRAAAQIAIVGAMDRAFDKPADDLAARMLDGGEIDDLVNQQRPILHQPEHRSPPVSARVLRRRRAVFLDFRAITMVAERAPAAPVRLKSRPARQIAGRCAPL